MGYTIDLTGKVAVVTGGTGVLGSAMCRGLAQAGAALAILGTTENKTQTFASELSAGGTRAVGIAVDVLNRATLNAANQKILEEFGKIDILVNCAGGNNPRAITSRELSFFDLPEDAVQWVFNLNFMGTFLPSQVFGKSMVQRGEGIIVNISSMASYQPMTRVPAYAGAKAAINNFTHWLAVHFAQEYSPNIRVNAIAPGFFITNQNRKLLLDENTGSLTERGQKIINHTPMNRFGDPDDLVGTLVWLASDASRFVTGIVVPVDGGFMAYKGV
jgi:NAD(P)-dependent dehydrogenase (short-subunit alcohol dehydrogenase family)